MARLDPSAIDRIIDVARGVIPSGPGDREDRESTRLPYRREVALVQITSAGEKTPPAILRGDNISAGGICLLSKRELDVGRRGAVLLLKSDGEAVVIGAQLVHCETFGPQEFECGFEFELQMTAVTLEDFQDAAGKLPDLRPARAA